MTPHQILIVVIRLLALLWFLYVLSNVGMFIGMAEALWSIGIGRPLLGVFGLVQLGACVLLWLFPATLASKLLRDGARPIPLEWADRTVAGADPDWRGSMGA